MGTMINTDTGEVIKNWKYREDRIDAPDENVRIRVHKEGTTFTQANVGCYVALDLDEQIDLHDEVFGELALHREKRKYTKVYQCHRPLFEKKIHYAYWLEVTYHITMNNGIIYRRDSHGKIFPVSTISDWQKLIDAGLTNTKEFIRDALAIKAVAKLTVGDTNYFIVNPIHCWNGNMIPKLVWSYFHLDELFKIERRQYT